MMRALNALLNMNEATAAALCIQIAVVGFLAILHLERGL